MNTKASDRSGLVVALLSLIAIGLLAAVYFTPIWWVSLTAPNYPPEAFPDGVRIHFHMNGVFNGCKKVEKAEIREEEALDCVHEMDTINHYVGMYPIAAGGVLEKAFSPFLIAMLAVMLIGFAIQRPRIRVAVLGVGFAGVLGWMFLTYYGPEGLRWQTTGFVKGLVTSLDQEAGKGEEAASGRPQSPGEALIAQLKAELAKSTGAPEPGPGAAAEKEASQKEAMLNSLRITFDRDQAKRPADERQEWMGTGSQIMAWHYGKSLGRYFNNPEEIRPMVATMSAVGHAIPWLLLGAMVLLLWGARRNGGPIYWLLVLVPLALPVFFLIDYSAWLWWYGHNLNAMGAFTVKPFMPTVFGDGKVAQFTTHSYPYWGFGLMLLTSAVLAVAALLRRKQLKG
ncbi:MAG: hypothetical protein ACM3ST_13525 [Bdellovibrio bacteriovorus]